MFFTLNSGTCNSFNCLGHLKHVYDDKDGGDGYNEPSNHIFLWIS